MIGFSAYKKDGVQRYAVRGIGIEYDEFGGWIRGRHILDVHSDWPWDAWTFADPVDEAEFLLKYDVPGTYFDRSMD